MEVGIKLERGLETLNKKEFDTKKIFMSAIKKFS